MSKATKTDLQRFQLSFGNYLRTQTSDTFSQAPLSRTRCYQSLVFNNIKGFLDKCFPICKQIMGEDNWLLLSQEFLKTQALHSPYFTDINLSFVNFLAEFKGKSPKLPEFLHELAHYEWVELVADIHPDIPRQCDKNTIIGHPSLQVLHYNWPVHRIDKDSTPQAEHTFLIVYRSETVKFVEINILSYTLMNFILENTYQNISNLIHDFLTSINASNRSDLYDTAEELILDFLNQGILIYS